MTLEQFLDRSDREITDLFQELFEPVWEASKAGDYTEAAGLLNRYTLNILIEPRESLLLGLIIGSTLQAGDAQTAWEMAMAFSVSPGELVDDEEEEEGDGDGDGDGDEYQDGGHADE